MTLPTLWLLLAETFAGAAAAEPRVITERLHHLGSSSKPDWKEFTTVEPVQRNVLDWEFQSSRNEAEFTLELQAGDVDTDWRVRLNDEDLGTLRRGEERNTQYFSVARGALKEGRNRLRVSGFFARGDDIYVGKAILHERPLREVAGYARVKVHVRDAESGQGLPSRLTIVRLVVKRDAKGRDLPTEELVDVLPRHEEDLAVRRGIVYTKNGAGEFDVLPGKYTLYATRGFEYGLAALPLQLAKNEERKLDLELRREVDTTGLLAADTHVHTKTYSGHGDISLEERVITIAGEGIELAIATDHNHHTDYRPSMEKVGLEKGFVPIIGNEVTTTWGHFNAFPLDKNEPPADHDHSDWANLVQAMRKSSGVRVLIVNHPRRTITDESTFGRIGLNAVSGEAHDGPPKLGIDAVEILNGRTLEEDGMLTLKDWFGMLNRGYRVAAVAGSDSHAVSDIVGQARTYLASSTDDPRKVRLDELCDAFLQGRLLVSLGLLVQVEVDGKHRPGDFASSLGPEVEVKIKVQGPSWTRADSVALYLNGLERRREKIEPSDKSLKYEAVWLMPRTSHDAHLVVVAQGPPVTAAYWPISAGAKGYVLGATNAVWLDGDGDGKFTSAFEYASRIAATHGFVGESTREALATHDAAVIAQFASLARAQVQAEFQVRYERMLNEADARLAELLRSDDSALKAGFDRYLAASPKLDVRTRADVDEKAAVLKKEEEDRKKRKAEEEERRRRRARGGRGRGD